MGISFIIDDLIDNGHYDGMYTGWSPINNDTIRSNTRYQMTLRKSVQLQKCDNSDEWVNYTDSLRLGAIQYDEATIMPIPIHLASQLQEYILEMK